MHTLPDLPYAYNALEPVISERIMRLHHQKHHQTYVDKLNAALESDSKLQTLSIEVLVGDLDSLPETIKTAVRNNGGGHLNHSFFWKCLAPVSQTGEIEDGALKTALLAKYDSLEAFQACFEEAVLGVFGSGWCWLMPDLSIRTTSNQDNPISEGLPMPILGLDVWEHAYYLDYQNVRADYVKQWWKVVNWQQVCDNYQTS